MKMKEYSVRRLLLGVGAGITFTGAVFIGIIYWLTRDLRVLLCGLVLVAAFLCWGVVFLKFFQDKLSQFTGGLCQTLDSMMDGSEKPPVDYEAETLLAKISHRLERLYGIMQADHSKVEAEKAGLQSLVSDISHQTKTLIANLKMINDTLMTRAVDEEQRQEFMQASADQLDKLEFMIQALVKTSRLETGVVKLEKKETPVSETLTAAVNGVLAVLEQRQLNLTIDCPEELTVCHDYRWTSEALYNLLDNAVKYTPVGGDINVSAESGEMYLRIDVSDSGRGIAECNQGMIFKRFWRDEAVHEVDGIGIGLYLAREIITRQGGYIKVESEVGKGSTFSVFLPWR